MRKSNTVKKVPDAKEAPNTVSLTRHLIGIGGVTCSIQDMGADGELKTHKLDVRRAILLSIKQGSQVASKEDKLSDAEQIRCWILGNAMADEKTKSYTFDPEDLVLIKKLARMLFVGVEPYCPLMEIIYPTALEPKEK